jgi:hypothetical protein
MMSVLGEVFGSLQAMTQLQLLLAFIACFGYAVSQGRLVSDSGRGWAVAMACAAAFGFALQSTDWTLAAMLFGFALAGLGSFNALVWLTSRALGLTNRHVTVLPSLAADSDAESSVSQRPPRAGGHAHSI